jgi:hypothetical protein
MLYVKKHFRKPVDPVRPVSHDAAISTSSDESCNRRPSPRVVNSTPRPTAARMTARCRIGLTQQCLAVIDTRKLNQGRSTASPPSYEPPAAPPD